jgi:PAS domain-containing protein
MTAAITDHCGLIEQVLNAMPLASVCWDEQLEPIACNFDAVTLFGTRDSGELLRYLAAARDTGEWLLTSYLRKSMGTGGKTVETEIYATDGSIVPVELILKPFKYSGFNCLITSCRDISRRKAGWEKAHETEQVLQLLFDYTPTAIAYWYLDDLDEENIAESARVIDCNQQLIDLFGFTDKDECLAKYKQLVPEYQPNGENTKTATTRIILETLKKGIVKYDWMHLTVDGELLPCAKTMVHVKNSRQNMIANFFTERREINATMNKLKEADERTSMVLDAMPLCAS